MNAKRPLIALAAVSASLALAGTASAASATLSNPSSIAPADRIGPLAPPGFDGLDFPSQIGAGSLTGSITNVKVTLKDVSSTFPADLDVMLVAPDGNAVMLMSDAGGGNDISHVNITFDDSAPTALPDGTGTITSGSYKPTNLVSGVSGDNDGFPLRVEDVTPSGATLASLDGHHPDGTWRLLVVDDQSGDVSTIAGGWTLSITTSDGITVDNGGELQVVDRASDLSAPGIGSAYPFTNVVSGAGGVIEHMAVTLEGPQFTNLDDIDLLLEGPNGRRVLLMSDAEQGPLANAGFFSFTDNARFPVPFGVPNLADAYLPRNYFGDDADAFPAPAPPPPYDASLDAFLGSSPNGEWRLYMVDDTHNGSLGELNGGYQLFFTLKPDPASGGGQTSPSGSGQGGSSPAPAPAAPAQEPSKGAAVLSGLKLKPKTFRSKKGSTVRYNLTADSRVTLIVKRRVRNGFIRLRGKLAQSGHAGSDSLRLKKVGGHALKPGSYRVIATPAGGKSQSAAFKVTS